MKSIFLTLVSLLFTATAHAQWKTTTYTLKGGWNSIYLHGDANYDTIQALMPSTVLEIWRWNPNPDQVGFIETPLIPSAGTAEWSVWKRDLPEESNLTRLTGQTAYLVRCSGTATQSYTVALKQSPRLPANSWVRHGANLLGFPSWKNGSTYPTMASYFSTFPAAISSNPKVYKYVGGDLGAGNPIQVFSPSSERLDSTQAYWFSAEVTGNYYAPLELSVSTSDGGLSFGRTGETLTLRLRNRSAAGVTVTFTSESSESSPSTQPTVAGDVALTRRSFNTVSGMWTETDLASAPNVAVGANSTVELSFGINRTVMMGAADDFYASLLRITESSGLLDIYLPVSARKVSLAGLWVGDISLDRVSSKVSNGAQAIATLGNGTVSALAVTGSGGSGYNSAPEVTIEAPAANGNGRAEATATLGAGGTLTALDFTNSGFGYSTAPALIISGASATVAATATAVLTNGSVTGYTIINPGSGYSSPPTVTVSPPPLNQRATASATVSNGVVSDLVLSNPGSGYSRTPKVTIAPPPVPAGTQAASGTYTVRTLLHVSDDGTARLLPEVYLGRLQSGNNDFGLCTSQSLLQTSSLGSARRLSSLHMPSGGPITCSSGSVALGSSVDFTMTLPFNDPTNPFVHRYHPDHDNRNATFDQNLPEGVESYTITRVGTFTFTASPPAGSVGSSGWGSSVIGGTYSETLTGLHSAAIDLGGSFVLRRASEIGSLSTP